MNVFVTDIDNTIADTRDRLRRSLEAIDRGKVYEETADRYGGFGDYLDAEEEEAFWSLFLSNRFLYLDRPAPGAAEFLRKIKNEAVEIVYLTGRHDEEGDSMRSGTESWLEGHGFPSPDRSGVKLLMKPRRKMEDRKFKLARLRDEFSGKSRAGEVIGIGDHPDDALVYNRAGIRPFLLDWLGLFSIQELQNSVSGVKIVEDWQGLERELYGSENRTQ
ncbi:hypothetical protein K9M06_04370 [Candidatus Bipolaricaulota bacterium]|nr:hypothetical protein [Candidatus Bipolaricaulota bacterium]MCF7890258.1 hypothetical protein [Candidatus Bipolaricaulota bacterium]